MERYFSWCDALWEGTEGSLLEDTPMYDAVRYSRNQRVGLHRFLDDGRLPIDNNISERALRRQAVVRKNWLFVGNDDGGQTNALSPRSSQAHTGMGWSRGPIFEICSACFPLGPFITCCSSRQPIGRRLRRAKMSSRPSPTTSSVPLRSADLLSVCQQRDPMNGYD